MLKVVTAMGKERRGKKPGGVRGVGNVQDGLGSGEAVAMLKMEVTVVLTEKTTP